MKKTLFIAFIFLSLSRFGSAEPLSPFCAGSTLFGPCGVGSAGPGGYYGVTFPAGYWPPYFNNGYQRRYAAIAYAEDGSGRYGASWNWLTLAGANQAALQYCGSSSCTVRVWALNGCASLSATIENKNLVGAAFRNERTWAKATAQIQCRGNHKKPCRTVVSVCNGW